jgi:hypothetical protein
MKIFSLLAVIFILFGCQNSSIPRGTHLSRAQAIRIAERVAVEHDERLENYRPPRVYFNAERGLWRISFPLKTPYTYGDPSTYHVFSIEIKDKTGNAEYIPEVVR